MRSLRLPLAALLLVVAMGAAFSAPSTDGRRHTRLVKSVPAKDAVVTAPPAALELWFSERIELPISKVQLVGPGDRAVPTAALTRADAADAPVVARVAGEMPDGAYVVNWTAGSRDGHAVKGSYRFSVKRP